MNTNNTAEKIENEISPNQEELDLEVEVIDDTPEQDKNKTRNEMKLLEIKKLRNWK